MLVYVLCANRIVKIIAASKAKKGTEYQVLGTFVITNSLASENIASMSALAFAKCTATITAVSSILGDTGEYQT